MDSLRNCYLDNNPCVRSVFPHDLGAYSVCSTSENISDLQSPIPDFCNSRINNHPARPVVSGVTGVIESEKPDYEHEPKWCTHTLATPQ